MARQSSKMKKPHTRHSQAFKDEALALAERIGVSKAASQLELHASQLYGKRGQIYFCRFIFASWLLD